MTMVWQILCHAENLLHSSTLDPSNSILRLFYLDPYSPSNYNCSRFCSFRNRWNHDQACSCQPNTGVFSTRTYSHGLLTPCAADGSTTINVAHNLATIRQYVQGEMAPFLPRFIMATRFNPYAIFNTGSKYSGDPMLAAVRTDDPSGTYWYGIILNCRQHH